MKELGSEFTVEIDRADGSQWDAMVREFDDANIYQAWGYETGRDGTANASHLVLRRNGRLAAVVQARIIWIPFLKTGMVHIRWGPLWKARNTPGDEDVFRQIVRAVRNEYLTRRGLAIRLVPHLSEEHGASARGILEEEGYVLQKRRPSYRTILMDIRPSLDDICRGFHQKWRNCLNSARKQSFELLEGEDDGLFEAFELIHTEMQERKQIDSYTELAHFREAQRALPADQKLRVVLCRVGADVGAGAICSGLGDTGLYIFGATSNLGLKTNGSYLVQWRMLEWLKQRGCQWYNLNGINPVTNEGTYRFKARLAGKHGHDVHFVGSFDAYPNRATNLLVWGGELLRSRIRKFRARTRPAPTRALAPVGAKSQRPAEEIEV